MPRHPPYALSSLTTIFVFILIWWDFLVKILLVICFSFKQITTLSSFQRSNISFFEKTLSSLKTKQNLSVAFFVSFFLLRKEVIHPHVLVGIPCYDFTPITCPTLNGPLHYWLGYHLRVLQTFVAWRAVCTTPGNVFTLTFWFRITSDSNFMKSSCRLQSELRLAFSVLLPLTSSLLFVPAIIARLLP